MIEFRLLKSNSLRQAVSKVRPRWLSMEPGRPRPVLIAKNNTNKHDENNKS
jgi:hypothetical protein